MNPAHTTQGPLIAQRTGTSSTKRLRALGRAEWLQFTRNRLLVVMALIFPLLLPLFFWLVGDQSIGSTAVASEMFALFALGFSMYYPVLSMAVTRRDENVLKRLRTGEARDWEILTAIGLPSGVLTATLSVIAVVAFSAMSMFMPVEAPVPHVWPVNPLLMVVAMAFGIACSHGLALLTSRFTANAENAQITSLPVLLLMICSQSSFREIIPERIGNVLDVTPFALTIDLFRYGWIGEAQLGDGQIAPGASLDPLPRLLILAGWAVVVIWGSYRYMRWETHR